MVNHHANPHRFCLQDSRIIKYLRNNFAGLVSRCFLDGSDYRGFPAYLLLGSLYI
jgi:hypothetical protein